MKQLEDEGRGSYRSRVSAEMQLRYGLTWDDACGDEQPLIRAREAGRTPAEFVAWWADKYRLTARKKTGALG